MISFKSFIDSIHRAVSDAADLMEEKNRELINRYFEAVQQKDGSESLVPKMVSMVVPNIDEEGIRDERIVTVPLFSLIPLNSSQIEKTTFTADIQLSVENGELNLAFPGEKLPKGQYTQGRLEIVISPTEPVEGLQKLIDAYADIIAKQL